jgi:hypothetical protein
MQAKTTTVATSSQSSEPSQSIRRKSEQQQLRPYRRLVTTVFVLGVIALFAFVGRGIIGHLDRMPSVDQFAQPDFVDHRALKACAEDLNKLERLVRKEAAILFTSIGPTPHEPVWQSLKKDRLKIIARCMLNEDGTHPAHHSLQVAAENIESQIRSFYLLYEKHQIESAEYSSQSREAIREALEHLKRGP